MELGERMLWVQRNRWRAARAVRLGPAVQCWMKRACAPEPLAHVEHAASLLTGLVDTEFRSHCRIASIRQGALVVHVDDPGMVYALRGRWRIPILEALGAMRGRAAVQRVIFEFGSTGWRIGAGQASSEKAE